MLAFNVRCRLCVPNSSISSNPSCLSHVASCFSLGNSSGRAKYTIVDPFIAHDSDTMAAHKKYFISKECTISEYL